MKNFESKRGRKAGMSSKKRPKETAAEFMVRLRSDPEWVRKHEEREAALQVREARLRAELEPEEAPLLAELRSAGVMVRSNLDHRLGLKPEPAPIRSISDLVNTRDSYSEAIPILVKHLAIVRHPVMVNSIARALAVKESRGTGAPRLILERLKQTGPCPNQSGDNYQARWALANSLTVVGDATLVEEIKLLIADSRFADVRDRLKDALKHSSELAGKRTN